MVSDAEWAKIEESIGERVFDFERKEFADDNWDVPNSAIGDWRNFIPEYVLGRWDELDEAGRLCVFVMAKVAAEQNARSPHWDE